MRDMVEPAAESGNVPDHLAVIMDGNGRWANARGLPRQAGHRAGVKTAQSLVEACGDAGIRTLTLFAFSSENWARPSHEVAFLIELFGRSLERELKRLHENGIRLRFIGDLSRFPAGLRQRISEAERLTADNDRMRLNIAVGYGGRWDILQAARQLAARVQAGELTPAEIDSHRFGAALSLGDMPEPDLFIRTGGERRISNFLLWHLAYTELYFCDTLWPDFDTGALKEALQWYAGRDRRFGRAEDDESAPAPGDVEQVAGRHA